MKSELSVKFKYIDACAFRLWLKTSALKFDSAVKSVHNSKLSKLSPDFSVDLLKPHEVILNLSSYNLSDAEKNVLVNGLNYTLATSDASDLEFTALMEMAARKIKHNY